MLFVVVDHLSWENGLNVKLEEKCFLPHAQAFSLYI